MGVYNESMIIVRVGERCVERDYEASEGEY